MPDLKPFTPLWQPTEAPDGCKLYLPLAEGDGTTVRDYAGGLVGSFVGSPTWQRGLYGPQLGGFTTSNYVAIDPPTQVLGSAYPFWMATLAVNTGTAPAGLISQGSSGGTTPTAWLRYNAAGAGKVDYFVRDNSGAIGLNAVADAPCNDGLPHVFMGVSRSPSLHEAYWDGQLILSAATTIGAMTCDRLSLGVIRRTTAANAFGGSLIWAGAGNGSVPDPLVLAQDKISGWLAAIRHQSNLALWAALAPTPVAPVGSPAAMMMGF